MSTSQSESDNSNNEEKYVKKSKPKWSHASSMASNAIEEVDTLSVEDKIVEISSTPAEDEIIRPFEGLGIDALSEPSNKDEVGFAMQRVDDIDICS